MLRTVRLPELAIHHADPTASGWFVLSPSDVVSVPSLDEVRRCAPSTAVQDPCVPRVVRFDPPHRTVIVDRGPGLIVVTVQITPGRLVDGPPTLIVRSTSASGTEERIEGVVVGPCRDELRFEWPVGAEVEDALYELSVEGYPDQSVEVALGAEISEVLAVDPCAVTMVPGAQRVGLSVETPPDVFPRPPLLAVNEQGCIVEAWSVNSAGWVLVARNEQRVELLQRCSGGRLATLELDVPVRDAVFWKEAIAVLTSNDVRLFDLDGCPLAPNPFATGFDNAVGLAVTPAGLLAVVQAGKGALAGQRAGNLHFLRRDGSAVRVPQTFEGRGFYAALRSPALVFDQENCLYLIDPSRVASDCCASQARPLRDEEALCFRLIDDLGDLRKRVAYPPSGTVVIGPAEEEDPLDAGRPGTQWHRILLFGEIPEGCGVRLETRAFDELVAGDPLLTDPIWSSPPATATSNSAVPVRSPGDKRMAAADAMVLARPGRFLWLRLTLLSNGIATPRITSIEIEVPRGGIARFLPAVLQNSTPQDDFLRRWLALFENTVFDGVAQRFDEYGALFDPRTAPPEMLPFLGAWLELLEVARLDNDEAAFRRALILADELARTRGTIAGLLLAIRIYFGSSVQIVESFKRRSGFILGAGVTLDGVTGPALGCQTALSAEPSGTWLGEEPFLGCSYLFDCEDRFGGPPFQFEVIVPARDVCATKDLQLLQFIIETEKPAHTRFRIRAVGRAGLVVGVDSVVGQEISSQFDRDELDPSTYGIGLFNGPPRATPIGRGFVLGPESRLASGGQPAFRLEATVGRSSRVGM